jgi:cytochrome bd-type quinol oxidase subunit 2
MSKKAKTEISQSVMEQIRQGDVDMRSRSFFTILTVLSFAVIVFMSMSIAYLMNIISLWWRVQTAETMAWGARANLRTAIEEFPWWALVLAVGMLAIAVWLLKKQGALYRYKTWVIAVVFILISLVIGLAVSPLGIGDIHNSSKEPGDYRQDRRRSSFE